MLPFAVCLLFMFFLHQTTFQKGPQQRSPLSAGANDARDTCAPEPPAGTASPGTSREPGRLLAKDEGVKE